MKIFWTKATWVLFLKKDLILQQAFEEYPIYFYISQSLLH